MKKIFYLLLCVAALSVYGADMKKELRIAFVVAETGFDPQAMSDVYSNFVNRQIFDPLYVYDYLARPYKLVANTTAALPEISVDGKHWLIRLKPGIYFTPDPVFAGKKRELVAEDYVYAWKRLLDPKMRSPYQYVVGGKFVGADAVVEAANKSGKFDYDAVIEGMRATDRYTIELKLIEPDYVLIHNMTNPYMAAVAREVIEKYGAPENTWTTGNPVGSGPYQLKEWKRASRIILEANPGYREHYFPESKDPADAPIMAQMKGKRLPVVGRIDIRIIEEDNPRFLAFDSKELDYVNIPYSMADRALDSDRLKANFIQRGITFHRVVEPGLIYAYFNMEDPVVGGYSKEKIALRRAMSMGFNANEMVSAFYRGQAQVATQPVPPNMLGHDPTIKHLNQYDPELSRAVLDHFGYKDCDGDGYRELPGCKPLLINMGNGTTARDREMAELWKKSMDAIGIKMNFLNQVWPELLKLGRAGKLPMWQLGWFSTITDGDTFLGLAYSQRIGQNNYSRFKLPEFDEFYQQAKKLPDSPERTALYRKMAELIIVYAPWHLNTNRYRNSIVHPWVLGYKQHAYYEHNWAYLDVDLSLRGAN